MDDYESIRIFDLSNQNLEEIPDFVLEMTNLSMLYVKGNNIKEIPDDFFAKLPNLVWLDFRENRLRIIPASIATHKCLETLLLGDNLIEKLPLELGFVRSLQVLQTSGNPLSFPNPEIIDGSVFRLQEFLRKEYQRQHLNSEKSELDECFFDPLVHY